MDKKGSSSSSYDFKTQAGVTALLMGVRESDLDSADKNDLRDLIFLYKNGGEDESVRIDLENKLASHKIEPVFSKKKNPKEEEKTKPVPELPFGSYRPAPVFREPKLVSKEESPNSPKKEEKEVKTKTQSAVKEEVLNVIKGNNRPHSLNVSDTSDKVLETPATTNKEQTAENKVSKYNNLDRQKPTAKTSFSVLADKPSVGDSVQTEKKSVSDISNINKTKSVEEKKSEIKKPEKITEAETPVNNKYLDRIRVIKSEVNKKVGNPVNLVDIDNEVGREYMGALLDAMKKLSGGEAGGIETAMERLETAFNAVDFVVEKANKKEVEKPVAKAQDNRYESKEFVKQQSVKQSNSIEINKEKEEPSNSVQKQSEPAVVEKSGFEKQPKEMTVSESVPSPSQSAPLQSPMSQPTQAPVSNPESTPVSNSLPIEKTSLESRSEVNANSTPSTSTQSPNRITSLAEERRILTPNDLPDRKDVSPEDLKNPLFTAEVDRGLDQLLSDWSLFKKSGLFGTGPHGKEHPLFKKISGLQIPLLLAGRFEGANQEIKQSITDYMNGWRYEQGIIYEQGETFELYLRRVIRHILDLQKRRNRA